MRSLRFKLVVILLIAVLLFPGCSRKRPEVELVSPMTGDQVSTSDAAVMAYMAEPFESADVSAFMEQTTKGDKPLPVKLEWKYEGFNASECTVYVSADSDFTLGVTEIKTENAATGAEIYYLYTDTVYYWKVIASDSAGNEYESAVWSFSTMPGPRWIDTDGVANVRDAGTWKTADGRSIKQGMIYRGAAFDSGGNNMITEVGIDTMLNLIGIKTDIDFRSESESCGAKNSVLSDEIKYIRYPIGGYNDEILMRKFISPTRTAFKLLLKEENYPVYLHCAGGADRTGTFVFLINGLLGVPEEDLIRDYELTSFSACGLRFRDDEVDWKFAPFLKTLKETYEGDTLKEKIEHLLNEFFTISYEDMDRLREILIEG